MQRCRQSSINSDKNATTNPTKHSDLRLEGSLGDLYIGAHPHSLDAIEPVECDSIPGHHSNQMHVRHGPGSKALPAACAKLEPFKRPGPALYLGTQGRLSCFNMASSCSVMIG